MTEEHYFAADPKVAAQRRIVEFEVQGRQYQLASAAGVFSADRLDPGTAVLLRRAPLPTGGAAVDFSAPLLDLGCGYGPIAVVLATSAPGATVYAVDVNQRAVALARQNAAALGIGERLIAVTPDEVPEDVRFAQIWSNPPIRVGKTELRGMLDRWLPRLAPDGVAWLVVARNLGGDSLHRWLFDQGWAVDRYASQKGYRILRLARS